ncbi:hypothetical protein [Azospirillum lipoferum]|uniref:hypothetical protein n=1 Tax=Azospirillum lipoferum TaxID=193 RepID=UPI0005CA9642|nr:hypothetical protein [Azospirillum lipoferum]
MFFVMEEWDSFSFESGTMRVRIEFHDLALDNFSADDAQELVAVMLTEGVMPYALRAGEVEITAWKPIPDEG